MEGLPKNCQGAPHTTPGRRRLAKHTRFNWDRRKACKMALERHSHGPVLETQVILFYLMLSGRNRVFREFLQFRRNSASDQLASGLDAVAGSFCMRRRVFAKALRRAF